MDQPQVPASVYRGSLRWTMDSNRSFQLKGTVAIVRPKASNDELVLAFHGRTINPDGISPLSALFQGHFTLPNGTWTVHTAKLRSQHARARSIKVSFGADATNDANITSFQLTVPISIMPNGKVEDPGRAFYKTVQALSEAH